MKKLNYYRGRDKHAINIALPRLDLIIKKGKVVAGSIPANNELLQEVKLGGKYKDTTIPCVKFKKSKRAY